MVKGRRKGRSSERIARAVLEDMGYSIVGENVKITVDGVDVGEVDLVVEDARGVRYAVEVKAGRVDVGGLRQAYVNSELLGCRPMVVCKGFADESAEALANRLGVEVVCLEELFIISPEEVEMVVEETLVLTLERLTRYTLCISRFREAERMAEHLSKSSNIVEFSRAIGATVPEAYRVLEDIFGETPSSKRFKLYRTAALISLMLRGGKAEAQDTRGDP